MFKVFFNLTPSLMGWRSIKSTEANWENTWDVYCILSQKRTVEITNAERENLSFIRDMSAVSLLSTSNWMKSWKHYRRSLILISSIYICFIGKFHWFFHLLLIKNLKCINCYTYFSTMTASLIMKFKKN